MIIPDRIHSITVRMTSGQTSRTAFNRDEAWAPGFAFGTRKATPLVGNRAT